MSIQRWQLMQGSWVERSIRGDYVAYADHASEIARLTAEIEQLRTRCETLAQLVYLYRHGVPLGHQPHMIASDADKALKEPTDG